MMRVDPSQVSKKRACGGRPLAGTWTTEKNGMGYRRFTDTAFPVKFWGGRMEEEAENQVRNLATLPFLFRHIAVMPDVHWGMGATVGTVLASRDAVIPAAVGVDIGCGMAAVRLPLDRDWLVADERLHRLRLGIEAAVPVGFAQHKPDRVSAEVKSWARGALAARRLKTCWEGKETKKELLHKALLQIGTLGGGNHFIEICHDERERGWLLLHSGSRHIGKRIADHYIRLAKEGLRRRGMLADLPDANLAWFQTGQPEFRAYLADLFWAQDYAKANREAMVRSVLGEIARLLGRAGGPADVAGMVAERVDCHHNYVARENHFGETVYVTRKGAVSAANGEPGIIPGSMGAASFIVEGKGEPQSFRSCAHGAGRAMSRREARRRFSVAELARQTDGVECRKDAGVLDEIPGAYKDIDQVMAHQADLVTIRHRLRQLICVKG